MMMQIEEDNSSMALLQEALDKVGQKANAYKRQLQEMVRKLKKCNFLAITLIASSLGICLRLRCNPCPPFTTGT